MADPTPSPRPSSTELFIISQLAGLRAAAETAQGTRERQLVATGQILEVTRQILDRIHPSPPPLYGPMKKLRAWANDIHLAHKLFVAWRSVSLPAAGYTLARWLGWL
jgi:hypothetical protein